MKNTIKKILSIILATVMLLTVSPLAYADGGNLHYYIKYGYVSEFGSYPQSEVTDKTLIAYLNSLAPEWEEWDSYGYYSGEGVVGTMLPGDWMRYTDVVYEGTKYRGVKFMKLRPSSTYSLPSVSKSGQYINGYYPNTVYWFKYEKICWRILDPYTGLVMCESIIDCQPYSNTVYNNLLCENFASDYEYSSIRKWLNNDFYNTAFDENEKSQIINTLLNNDGYRTLTGDTRYDYLDSNETDDKVFLLSYSEVMNHKYGFDPHDLFSRSRQGRGSDYAKSQGLSLYGSQAEEFLMEDSSPWLLRTPGAISNKCCWVEDSGDIYSGDFYAYNDCSSTLGVRPALRIPAITHPHNIAEIPAVAATCITAGKTAGKKCFECNEIIQVPEEIPPLGHIVDWITNLEPTCTENGKRSGYCTGCKRVVLDELPALGHDLVVVDELSVTPTCTENGYTYSACSRCLYKEEKTVNAYHAWSEWEEIKAPTCEAKGLRRRACTECNTVENQNIDSFGGHEVETLIGYEANCVVAGQRTASWCRKCKYIFEPQEEIPAFGHSWSEKTIVPATCTEFGFWETTCHTCNSAWGDLIPPSGHTYTAVTFNPTCTEAGSVTYTCTCGDTYTETLEAIGHNFDGSECINCDYDKADDCSCNCHKDGISGLIWKILNFFYKLFKTNKTCACGIAHY